LLLSYFGEKDPYRCGICDVCLERNKLELSNLEFEQVSSQIKFLLHEHSLSLTELVHAVLDSREDKTLKVIQWLLDNSKLAYDEENQLHWKK
jgi:ATP-dependent DNA helicase RecQ